MMRLPHSLGALVLSGAVGIASLLQSGTAEAGRGHRGGSVHFSGQVRVRAGAGVSVRVGRSYARPWHRHRWFGGTVWVGGYYYPRPYYYYYPEYVPSYYGSYYPVEPMAAPGVAVAAPVVAPPPAPPTFGIGVFAGGTSVRENQQESSDLGVLGRIRLTPGLIVEGEFAKTSFKDDVRVDRRFGGSLIWEIGARHALAPYLLGGGGVNQAEVDGSFTTTQSFGEVGVGLRLALSRNLHVAFDVRGGIRKAVDSNQPNDVPVAVRSVAPPAAVGTDDNTENYGRARLAAILNF